MTSASYTIVAYKGRCLPTDYEALVFSKWLRSLRYGNDFYRLVDQRSYYSSYHTYIQHLLDRQETQVRVARLTDDADVVLGFSVSRGTVLDYVHVHKDQRRLGIGRRLVPEGIDTITHLTRVGMTIWAGKMKGVQFNPFA